MRKIIFIILCQIFIFEISPQENDEYLILYNEINKIVETDFILPVKNQRIEIINDYYWGFGHKIDIFNGEIMFLNSGHFLCNENAKIYSMTDGIIENIYYQANYGFTIDIKFNEITISYMSVRTYNLQIGSKINKGEFIGTVNRHSVIHFSFFIMIKYKNYYFDPGILLSTKIEKNNEIFNNWE